MLHPEEHGYSPKETGLLPGLPLQQPKVDKPCPGSALAGLAAHRYHNHHICPTWTFQVMLLLFRLEPTPDPFMELILASWTLSMVCRLRCTGPDMMPPSLFLRLALCTLFHLTCSLDLMSLLPRTLLPAPGTAFLALSPAHLPPTLLRTCGFPTRAPTPLLRFSASHQGT